MARITIEDCLTHIPNRFELTLAAANRARLLSTGAQPLLDPMRDKPTVIALREIAAGKVGAEMLHKQTANKVSLAETFSEDTLFTTPITALAQMLSPEIDESGDTSEDSDEPLVIQTSPLPDFPAEALAGAFMPTPSPAPLPELTPEQLFEPPPESAPEEDAP